MKNLFLLAHLKPAPEFISVFTDADTGRLDDKGRSLLMYALQNKDLASRYELAGFLLDAGCPLGGPGNGGATLLHVLFGQVKHDIPQDVDLARRLIDRGADINAVNADGVLPFQLVLNMKYTDDDLAPIYDLWFAQPAIDFTTESRYGLSPLTVAAKLPYRAAILARMEDYVAQHP